MENFVWFFPLTDVVKAAKDAVLEASFFVKSVRQHLNPVSLDVLQSAFQDRKDNKCLYLERIKDKSLQQKHGTT